MAREYTIELTDAEAMTVERMAAGRGKTPEQIVQFLVRNRLFDVAVSLATEEWTWNDILTGIAGPDPARTEQQYREYEGVLLDGKTDWGETVQ